MVYTHEQLAELLNATRRTPEQHKMIGAMLRNGLDIKDIYGPEQTTHADLYLRVRSEDGEHDDLLSIDLRGRMKLMPPNHSREIIAHAERSLL